MVWFKHCHPRTAWIVLGLLLDCCWIVGLLVQFEWFRCEMLWVGGLPQFMPESGERGHLATCYRALVLHRGEWEPWLHRDSGELLWSRMRGDEDLGWNSTPFLLPSGTPAWVPWNPPINMSLMFPASKGCPGEWLKHFSVGILGTFSGAKSASCPSKGLKLGS